MHDLGLVTPARVTSRSCGSQVASAGEEEHQHQREQLHRDERDDAAIDVAGA